MSLDHTANAVDMSKFKNKIFAHMEIANELVKIQVDSGASCNVLPRKFLPRDTEIKKTNLKLTNYSKTNLKVLGVAKISLRNPKNKKKSPRDVWSRKSLDLLERPASVLH